MFTITCKGCSATVSTADASDPHPLLACGCCPLEGQPQPETGSVHHHGVHANATGTPCRPVTITVVQLAGPLSPAAA